MKRRFEDELIYTPRLVFGLCYHVLAIFLYLTAPLSECKLRLNERLNFGFREVDAIFLNSSPIGHLF